MFGNRVLLFAVDTCTEKGEITAHGVVGKGFAELVGEAEGCRHGGRLAREEAQSRGFLNDVRVERDYQRGLVNEVGP